MILSSAEIALNNSAIRGVSIQLSPKTQKLLNATGERNPIDYILINNRWKNSALNCEVCNNFYAAGSVHHVI